MASAIRWWRCSWGTHLLHNAQLGHRLLAGHLAVTTPGYTLDAPDRFTRRHNKTGAPHVVPPTGSIRPYPQLDGPATVKNSDDPTTIGEVGGELRISADNGDIAIGRARSSVSAKSAHGSIRIGEVVRGSILLQTAYSGLEVGICNGTAA